MDEGATLLEKLITMRHAVALYISSVLRSGVLVLPGPAARLAGPECPGVGLSVPGELSIRLHLCIALGPKP